MVHHTLSLSLSLLIEMAESNTEFSSLAGLIGGGDMFDIKMCTSGQQSGLFLIYLTTKPFLPNFRPCLLRPVTAYTITHLSIQNYTQLDTKCTHHMYITDLNILRSAIL